MAISSNKTSRLTRSITRLNYFENSEFDFQLLRILGVECYGGSALGECLNTYRRIQDGSVESWCAEWTATATTVRGIAEEAVRRGDRIGAREAFLRASVYYRAAEYYSFYSEPSRRENWKKSKDCFCKAGAFFDPPFEPVEIPFEDKHMPGYFIQPSGHTGKRPTIIIIPGFDGSAEELYFFSGAAALQRGYNILLFEGPGHTGMLHRYPDTPFRPDFEKPMGAAVDYLLNRPEVDGEHLGLVGLNMGGYFATRSVVYEKRIKACVANSPIVNLHDYLTALISPEVFLIDPEDYPYIMQESGYFRWAYETFKRRFGINHFRELPKLLETFSYEGMEQDITCHTLTLVGEGEGSEALGQAWHFYNSVSGPRTQHIFTVTEGADAHCQVNNLRYFNTVVYRWLDEVMRKNEP